MENAQGLPDVVVRVVLAHITPPDALAIDPIPEHLLSPALAQHHHSLSITPADPAAYLCWPQDACSAPAALSLLERISEHPLPPEPFTVRYTDGPTALFAHACVPDPTPASGSASARLVFVWDYQRSTWLFHSLALLPFPPHSHPDIHRATAPLLFPAPFPEQPDSLEPVSHAEPDNSILTFSELKELIDTGRVDQIPNNKQIPKALNEAPPSDSIAPPRKKPWEKP